jgi:hypothetical protein
VPEPHVVEKYDSPGYLPEDLQGGVALDTVLLAEVSLNSAVDLGKLDTLLLQLAGSNLVLGSYSREHGKPRSLVIRLFP